MYSLEDLGIEILTAESIKFIVQNWSHKSNCRFVNDIYDVIMNYIVD